MGSGINTWTYILKEPHPLWRVLLRWSLCRSGVEQHMDPFITDNQVARLSFRKEAAPHGYCSCALQSWALHRAGTDPGPSFCCFLLCEWAFSSHFITVSATREQLTCWLSWSTLATEMPLSREDSRGTFQVDKWFWNVLTILFIIFLNLLTPQSKGTGWPQTELTMNGLEKSPGDLDIAYRDIYECLTGNRGR